VTEPATTYDWQTIGTYRVRRLKIVVPFVQGHLADATKAWGESQRALFVDLTGDDEGYFKLITQLWREGDWFLIVEQDVVPDPQQFNDMCACPKEWCAGVHKSHYNAPDVWSMGLMKFSDQLLARHFEIDGRSEEDRKPDGAECIAQRLELTGTDYKPMGSDRRWHRVDLAVYSVIAQAGAQFRDSDSNPLPHLHGPAGQHLGRR
jgi:hypothetical protein